MLNAYSKWVTALHINIFFSYIIKIVREKLWTNFKTLWNRSFSGCCHISHAVKRWLMIEVTIKLKNNKVKFKNLFLILLFSNMFFSYYISDFEKGDGNYWNVALINSWNLLKNCICWKLFLLYLRAFSIYLLIH